MPDLQEPSELLRQITEHLKLEGAMGGDWIPVTRSQRKAGGKSQERTGAQTQGTPKKSAGLARITPAVRPVDPETVETNRALLLQVTSHVARCKDCGLSASRTNTVPGEGHPAPRLVFVGEGPGREEDLSGRPFVGKAGLLLSRMISAIGLSREEVFILNTVKCRPPGNRTPEPEEMQACRGYLDRQLQILQPEIIVTLGRPASQSLLSTSAPISRLRGNMQNLGDTPVMPTFHPAYLLRNVTAKKDAWEDLKKVHAYLTREPESTPGEPDVASPPDRPPDHQGSLFG